MRLASFSVAGLGLVAGAVLYASPAQPQAVPPPASETPIPPEPRTDSLPPRDTVRSDTVRSDTVRSDTIKAPIGRALEIASTELTGSAHWTHDELLASGALTLADLLQRIPEITVFRSGWIASPQIAAVAGQFGRVRFFLDRVEIDPIDPRERTVNDLAHIPLWSLDDLVIERAGGEVRVYMRSWGVQRTTPYTRTDVLTGTEDTNIYRGLYGKRFFNGAVFQAGAEQSSTDNPRLGGGGDALSLVTRIGVGRASWSFDAFVQRTHYNRRRQLGAGVPRLPGYDATHTIGYVRASIGHLTNGPWLELLAATHGVREGSPRIELDTADTNTSRAQYVASAGYRLGRASLTVTDRYRRFHGQYSVLFPGRFDGSSSNSLTGRLDFEASSFAASVSTEQSGGFRTSDARVRVRPLPFIALSAAASNQTANGSHPAVPVPNQVLPPEGTALRLEGGLRVGRLWLYGGAYRLDGSSPARPVLYDSAYLAAEDGKRNGSFAGMRGKIWRGIGTDSWVMHWTERRFYQPEYAARSELNVETDWRSRFPRGDFSFKLAATDDFRSAVYFPVAAGVRKAGASHILSGLLEIRIVRATVSVQVRNPIGLQYFVVPGFDMPRSLSTYGVRWFFWG